MNSNNLENNNDGKIDNLDKLKTITNILQKYFFLFLYLVFLPILISFLIGYILINYMGGPQNYKEQVAISVSLIIYLPTLMLFLLPFDRYRKNKLFKPSVNPTIKHLYLFFLPTIIAVCYSMSCRYFMSIFGIESSIFFSSSNLFIRIEYLIIIVLITSFYLKTRQFPEYNLNIELILEGQKIKSREKQYIYLVNGLRIAYILFFNSISGIYILLGQELLLLICFLLILKRSEKMSSQVAQTTTTPSFEEISSDTLQPQLKFSKIPKELRSQIIFNEIPIIYSFSIIISMFISIAIYFESYTIILYIFTYFIGLCLKIIYYIYYGQIKKTNIGEFFLNTKKIKTRFKFSNIISYISLALIIILNFFDIISISMAMAFLVVLLYTIFKDAKIKIISEHFLSAISILTSLTFIFALTLSFSISISSYFYIEPIYLIILTTILVYLDLEILIRKAILNKSQFAVLQSLLGSLLVLEIFSGITSYVIDSQINLLSDPNLVNLFRYSSYLEAFLISGIFSLIIIYYTRLKYKTNKPLKYSLISIHLMFIINSILLFSLNIGGFLDIFPQDKSYFIFSHYLIPALLFLIINYIIFAFYFRVGIYNKKEIAILSVLFIDLTLLIIGLSVLIFNISIFGIISFLTSITIAGIIHLGILYKNELLSKHKYEVRINSFGYAFFFEINAIVYLVLTELFNVENLLALIITSFILLTFFKLLTSIRPLFLAKFKHGIFVICFIIQLIFIPLFENPYILQMHLNLLAIIPDLPKFLQYIPTLLIIIIYLVLILSYLIKAGQIFRKFWIHIENGLFFLLYLVTSALPYYFSAIIYLIAKNNINLPSTLDYNIFTGVGRIISGILFMFLIFLDNKYIFGLNYLPKKWVATCVKNGTISLSLEDLKIDQLEKRKRILNSTLEFIETSETLFNEDIEDGGSGESGESGQNTENSNYKYLQMIISGKKEYIPYKIDSLHKIISFISSILILYIFGSNAAFIFGLEIIEQMSIKIGIIATFLAICLINFIDNFARTSIISIKTYKASKTIIYIFFIIFIAYDVYLGINLIPSGIELSFQQLLAVFSANIFIFLIFIGFKNRLISFNPKLYYYGISFLWTILSIIIGVVFAFGINLLINYLIPTGFLNILFNNILFLSSMAIVMFLAIANHSISILKSYNRFIMRDVVFINEFSDEVMKDEELVNSLRIFARMGISDLKSEAIARMKYPIARVYRKNNAIYFFLYLMIGTIFSEIGLIYFNYSRILPQYYDIIISLTALFGILYILLRIDRNSWFKLGLDFSAKYILVSWQCFLLGNAFCIATFFGFPNSIINSYLEKISIIFLIIFLGQFQTNKYLVSARISFAMKKSFIPYSIKISQILNVCFSALYLLSRSVNFAINYNDFQILATINSVELSNLLFRVVPIAVVVIYVLFYTKSIKLELPLSRYLKTFIYAFIFLFIAFNILPYLRDIINYLSEMGVDFESQYLRNDIFIKEFMKELVLTLICVILVIIPLFYYFSALKRQNALINLMYEVVIVILGLFLINNIVYEIFILLVSIPFANISPVIIVSGINGVLNPSIVDYLWFERLLITCTITFLLYYYLKKTKYYENIQMLVSKTPQEEFLETFHLGLFSGILRSIGFAFLVLLFYNIPKQLVSFSIISPINLIRKGIAVDILNLLDLLFIISISIFAFAISFYYFMKKYLYKNPKLSYQLRFGLRIIAILSICISIACLSVLYEQFYNIVVPILLVISLLLIIKIQKYYQEKFPYRASISFGVAKGSISFFLLWWGMHVLLLNNVLDQLNTYNPSLISQFLQMRFYIEFAISAGITGFILSRTIKGLKYTIKRVVIPIILIESVVFIGFGFYLIFSNLNMFIPSFPLQIDNEFRQLSFLITLDLCIFLFYLAIGIYQWNFKIKELWRIGWVLWLFLPIINFNLIQKSLSGIDFVTSAINIFGNNMQGSFILSLFFATLMYLPIIITRVKRIFIYSFLAVWIESLLLWIWISLNLNTSSLPAIFALFLQALFIIGLGSISLMPMFYYFKYNKIIAIFWGIIAFANATFLSLYINTSFVPDILMDISINLLVYGLFLILFTTNPVVKNSIKYQKKIITIGFLSIFAGFNLILSSLFYGILKDIQFALYLSLIASSTILLFGKSSKLQIFSKKINLIVSLILSTSLGLLIYRIFYIIDLFPISISQTQAMPINLIYVLNQIDLFALGIGTAVGTGALLYSQLRRYISRMYWQIIYAVFSIAISIAVSTIIQSIFSFTFELYLGFIFLIFSTLGFPSIKKNKISFWFLLSLSISLFTMSYIYKALDLIANLLGTTLALNVGSINIIPLLIFIFVFCIYIDILILILQGYYIKLNMELVKKFENLGIIDEEGNIIKPMSQVIEENPQIEQSIRDIFKKYESIPPFFDNPKNVHYIISLSILIGNFTGSIIIACTLTSISIFRLIIMIIISSIFNFQFLKYNKNKNIFQNNVFNLILRNWSIAIIYLFIATIITFIEYAMVNFLAVLLSFSIINSIKFLLYASFFFLALFITIATFDSFLKLYSKKWNYILKITYLSIFSLLFTIVMIITVPFILGSLIFLSSMAYILSRYLKSYYNYLQESLSLFIELNQIEMQQQQMQQQQMQQQQISQQVDSLEQEHPNIGAPTSTIEEIFQDELFANIDLDDVKDSLDQIFGDASLDIQPQQQEIEDQQPPTQPSMQISNQILLQIEKKQNFIKKIQKVIKVFEAIIKQSFIIELSYIPSLIILNIFASAPNFKFPNDVIIGAFIFTVGLALFYNYTNIIQAKYQIKIAQTINILLLILTLIFPFSIFNTFAMELKLIGDGKFAPLGQIYIPNLIFLISFTILLVLVELLKIIKNYASTKNIHIQKAIIARWENIIHPAEILLIAFIVANIFSYDKPFVTRITLASFILLLEITADQYLFKLYNPLTRARALLISWILFSALLFVQLSLYASVVEYGLILFSFATLIFTISQFLTIYLIFNFKIQKTMRKYDLTEKDLARIRYLQKIIETAEYYGKDLEETEEFKNLSELKEEDKISILEIGDIHAKMEGIDPLKALPQFKNYKARRFSIIALLTYLTIGFFVFSISYQLFLSEILIDNYNSFAETGYLIETPQGAAWIISILVSILILIGIPLIFSYFDKFWFKIMTPLHRDSFILVMWILLNIDLYFLSHFNNILNPNNPITTSISSSILIIIAIFQYNTMALISNIIIHSIKQYQISDFFNNKIKQFKKENLEFFKSNIKSADMIAEWEYLPESQQKYYKKQFIHKLIGLMKPKLAKIMRIVNIILGIFVYSFIGYSIFELIYNLSFNILFALFMAFGTIYAQSELNYFKIKSFSEKYNFVFTLSSWILFSFALSFLPLLLLNTSFFIQFKFFFTNISIPISNLLWINLILILFNLSLFYATLIVKRYMKSIDVKLQWFKYLRISLYLFLALLPISFLLLATSLNFTIMLASIILYAEMEFEKNKPIILKKTIITLRIVAGILIAVSISLISFDFVSIEFLDTGLAIRIVFLVLTLFSTLVYNPLKNKRATFVFWIILAIEIGLLSEYVLQQWQPSRALTCTIALSFGFMLLYPLFFQFSKIMEIIKTISLKIQNFFINIRIVLRDAWNKMANFIRMHANIFVILLALFITTMVYLLISPLFPLAVQKISISSAIGSVFLYPIFKPTKNQIKDEHTFSMQLYYAFIVYVMLNFVIYSFIKINIIWFLISTINLCAITIVVIYRREKIYNLSVKWRFSFLLATIFLSIIFIIVVLLIITKNIEVEFALVAP
ncbi:MAG: hypothetical protein ACTSRZ_12915 [Promethearchaeota archaeon]